MSLFTYKVWKPYSNFFKKLL